MAAGSAVVHHAASLARLIRGRVGMPVLVLTLVGAVMLKLAISDGGRHPPTLVFAQTTIFAVLAVLEWTRALRRTALTYPLLCMLAAAVITSLWSVQPEASVRELLLWTMYLGIALGVASTVTDDVTARRFLDALVFIAGWLCLIALFVFWGSGDPARRWYSTFYWPNPFAAFLLLVLPLSLVRTLRAPHRRQTLAQGAFTVLLGVSFIFTYSRGAWLVLAAVAPVALAVLHPRSWGEAARRAAVIAVSILVAVVLLLRIGPSRSPEPVIERATSIVDPADASLQGRLNFWQAALRMFADHPLVGTGPGAFGAVHPAYQRDVRYYARDPHNLYLRTAAEMGVVGFGAFAFLLSVMGVLWKRLLRQSRDFDAYTRAAGIGLGLLAFLLHSGVDMNWSFPANPAMAFALAGVMASMGREQEHLVVRRRHWALATRAAAIVAIVLAVVATQLVRLGEVRFVQGQIRARDGDWTGAVALYAQATRWHPLSARYQSAEATAAMRLRPPQRERAETSLRRAMRLDAMNASYPLALALVVASAPDAGPAQFADAENLLLHALTLDPFNRPKTYRELARLYARWDRPEDAARVYRDATARYLGQGLGRPSIIYVLLWPEVIDLALEAADFFRRGGNAAGAERVWRNLLAEDPGVIPAALQLSELYARAGRLTDARAVLLAALARVPANERLRAALQALGP